MKDSDGEKFYASLTPRISAGESARAKLEDGKWYALLLLGSADGQSITGTVSTAGSPPPQSKPKPVNPPVVPPSPVDVRQGGLGKE